MQPADAASAPRRAPWRFWRPLTLALGLLAAGACEDATEPLPEPVSFSGELARHATVSHEVTFAEAGLVEVRMATFDLRDTTTGEITQPTRALRLGLGSPDTDPDDEDDSQDEGETEEDFCDETFFGGVIEGSVQVFRLEQRAYCISLTDIRQTDPALDTIPEGKVGVYALTLTSTE